MYISKYEMNKIIYVTIVIITNKLINMIIIAISSKSSGRFWAQLIVYFTPKMHGGASITQLYDFSQNLNILKHSLHI